MSGTTTQKPASTSSGATACQVDPVRGCPWMSSTGGPSPPWRTRRVAAPTSMRSSRKPGNTDGSAGGSDGALGARLVGGQGDQHRADPVAAPLGLLGDEDQAPDLDPGTGDGDLAEVLGHQSADRVDLVVLDLDPGDLVEVVDREAGGDTRGAVLEGLDVDLA